MFSEGVNNKGNRERILSYLVNNPGSSLSRISNDLNIAKATLRYHIDRLEKSGSIFPKKDGGMYVYFSSGKTIVHNRIKDDLSVHENRILSSIRNRPGIDKEVLFSEMGFTKKKMMAIIRSLKETGLIWEVEVNGRRTFQPVSKEMVLKEMMMDIVEMYLEGEMDVESYTRMKKKIQKQMF